MKRTLLILMLGLAGGLCGHFGWLRGAGGAERAEELAWMQARLELDEVQLARLKVLHERSAPRLQALAEQVDVMRAEREEFEQRRMEEGRVDFLEYARFMEGRRQLRRECALSTERLVRESSKVMTEAQRVEYLNLLKPELETLKPLTSTSG